MNSYPVRSVPHCCPAADFNRFSVLTILVSEPLLRLIQVPKEVMPDALAYLRIIFIGILFTFIYNFLANTLRALGDSKTPLYFLVASAILNVLGDLLLWQYLDGAWREVPFQRY